MFRDKREFHAVALQSPTISSMEDIYRMFPHGVVSDRELLPSSRNNLLIEHSFYHSQNQYVFTDGIEQMMVKRGTQQFYRYNMYCMAFSLRSTHTILIAVPFLQMGREVFGQIHRKMQGRNLSYEIIRLDRLLDAIVAKRHRGGHVKITRLDLLVYGDPNANSLIVRGKDAVFSGVFQRVSAHRKGLELTPRKCRVEYDTHEGQRFALDGDRFGNYTFRVVSRAKNLPWISYLLTYFYEENMVESTPAFPLRKGAVEEDEHAF